MSEEKTEIEIQPDALKRIIKKIRNRESRASVGSMPSESKEVSATRLTQWATCGPDHYIGVSDTTEELPAGVYNLDMNSRGEPFFKLASNKVDDLLELPDSLHKKVLDEIDWFWSRGEEFKKYGFLHRRGFLLYGPAGGGKTCIVQQVIARIVSAGDIVLLCDNPTIMAEATAVLRQVEPERRVVCVFEDIDAIAEDHGEEKLLSLLDGEAQIDHVLNLATTNYPERLDPRISSRPRRFDRVIPIGMPGADVRHFYLKTKMLLDGEELDMWVKKTDGLSFAALAELVISVKCLGNKFEDTLEILRKMAKAKASSDEFKKQGLGFELP